MKETMTGRKEARRLQNWTNKHTFIETHYKKDQY